MTCAQSQPPVRAARIRCRGWHRRPTAGGLWRMPFAARFALPIGAALGMISHGGP